MQFVCSSEGAANWPAGGAAKPNVSPLSAAGIFSDGLYPRISTFQNEKSLQQDIYEYFEKGSAADIRGFIE